MPPEKARWNTNTNSQNDLVEWGLFFGHLESALRGVIETGRFTS
jgi:hypothetical protein